jgi:hypothetical protein
MSCNNNPRSPWAIAAVQFVGWTGAFAAATFFMKGLMSGAIRPAEIAARLPHYRDVVVHALAVSLVAVAALAVLIAVVVLTARHGRVWLAVWWRYRRRWAEVLADHDLTTVAAGRRLVPRLLTVTSLDGADVARVRMLDGQSPQHWAGNAGNLASAFGATDGRVEPARERQELDLVFTRGGRGGGYPALSAGGAQVLTLPSAQRARRPVAIRIQAFSLQICWARVQVRAHNGQTKRFWGARGRWGRWETTQWVQHAQHGALA